MRSMNWFHIKVSKQLNYLPIQHAIFNLCLSVNALVKHYYGIKWEDYQTLLREEDATDTGRFKIPSKELKLQWISYAWDQITQKNVRKSWNWLTREELNQQPKITDEEKTSLKQVLAGIMTSEDRELPIFDIDDDCNNEELLLDDPDLS